MDGLEGGRVRGWDSGHEGVGVGVGVDVKVDVIAREGVCERGYERGCL